MRGRRRRRLLGLQLVLRLVLLLLELLGLLLLLLVWRRQAAGRRLRHAVGGCELDEGFLKCVVARGGEGRGLAALRQLEGAAPHHRPAAAALQYQGLRHRAVHGSVSQRARR